MDPKIDDYIRDNRAKYTPEAIRAQLIAAGHDSAAVNAAWDRAVRDSQTPPSTRSGGGLAVFAVILFVLGGLVGAFGVLMLAGFNSYLGVNMLIFIPAYAVLYIAVGLGVVWLVRWSGERFHLGGLWAVLVGLILIPVYGALMYGGCYAASLIGRG
jgi:hypothetical protein